MCNMLSGLIHNSGISMSPDRRKKLVALSKAYSFLIVSDEVYLLLRFPSTGGEEKDELGYRPQPLTTDDYEPHTVLSIGSFSKIAAPGTDNLLPSLHPLLFYCQLTCVLGLRVAWVHANAVLLNQLTENKGVLTSGGGLCSSLTCAILATSLKSGRFEGLILSYPRHSL